MMQSAALAVAQAHCLSDCCEKRAKLPKRHKKRQLRTCALASHSGFDISIQNAGRNGRFVTAGIDVAAPPDAAAVALSSYASLQEFVPGLTLNEVLEWRPNGALLAQESSKEIFKGFTFRWVAFCKSHYAELVFCLLMVS
jgi:hypothetical protein